MVPLKLFTGQKPLISVFSNKQDEYPGFAPESFSEKICNAADIRINDLCIYNISSLLLYTVFAKSTPKPTIK